MRMAAFIARSTPRRLAENIDMGAHSLMEGGIRGERILSLSVEYSSECWSVPTTGVSALGSMGANHS